MASATLQASITATIGTSSSLFLTGNNASPSLSLSRGQRRAQLYDPRAAHAGAPCMGFDGEYRGRISAERVVPRTSHIRAAITRRAHDEEDNPRRVVAMEGNKLTRMVHTAVITPPCVYSIERLTMRPHPRVSPPRGAREKGWLVGFTRESNKLGWRQGEFSRGTD